MMNMQIVKIGFGKQYDRHHFHDETGMGSAFPAQADGFEKADGSGEIHYYRLFDGVGILLLRLEMETYTEMRTQVGVLEVNFCINGRFETSFPCVTASC